jgi:hypothetical protein
MIPVLVIMGTGMALTMAPMTAAVMNAVGHERAGLGSAMTNTSREVGGVLGIALLGTLLTTELQSSIGTALARIPLPRGLAVRIAESAGHGRLDPTLLGGLDPTTAAAVRRAFQVSFLDGFQLALMVGGAIVVVAGVVANRFIPSGPPAAQMAAAERAAAH